jgi:hypothetical protein
MGVLMILVLTALSEDVLYYRYQNGNREDWRPAIEFVEQNKKTAIWSWLRIRR